MSITPRGTSFQATIHVKGVRYRRNFQSLPEAQQWEADSKASALRGETPTMGAGAASDGLPRTLGELYQHTFQTRWAHQKSASTATINGKSVVAILGAGTPVGQLDKQAGNRLAAALRAGGSSTGTVNRKLSALSTMLREAEELGVIAAKPRIKLYKEAEGRIRRFTAAEEKAGLAWFTLVGEQEMVDYLVLSLDTGLRQEEVLRLDDQRTSDPRYVKVFDGKDNRNRAVPVTPRAAEVVKRRRELGFGFLFQMDKDQLRRRWDRFRASMKATNDACFVPHILRHEFCSRLADNGEGAAVIMALAGHANLTTSQRYIHMSPTALEAAIARLANRPTLDVNGAIQSRVDVADTATPRATGHGFVAPDFFTSGAKVLETNEVPASV